MPLNTQNWREAKEQILGEFNAGQFNGLTANGSITLTPDQQRKEAGYACRDAQKAVEDTEKYFRSLLTRQLEEVIEIGEKMLEIEPDNISANQALSAYIEALRKMKDEI